MPAGPDFSALERHLFKITSQIEALQRPDGIEQSIAAFRSELSEIRHAITEAMPRRAIESIESEIRSLSRRIDETRQNGIDGQALAGIERALSEIREVLRSLTPAEQLAGYDDAIRNLGAKLDLILRASDDPGTMRQLEGAIAALRAIVSNVASNDALARLSEDVRLLSSKVDQLGRIGSTGDAFAVLEQRIAALTSTLEGRERPAASESSEHLEGALRALSDRLDRMPVGNDDASAFAHLEQRVSYLLERLETSADHRAGNLARVEDGLQDILRHLEAQQANYAALAGSASGAASPDDSGLIDTVKRELSDIRFNQTETNRHTQDSLEAVHNTLGHVVDRLAMIEGDLRSVRMPPVSAPVPPPVTPSALRTGCAARRAAHRSSSPNCPIQLPRTSISPPRPGISTPFRHLRRPSVSPRPEPSAKSWIRKRRAARGDRTGAAAGPSARAGDPADRPAGVAFRADRGFGRRRRRHSGEPAGPGQFDEFHRRRAPRRAGRRQRAGHRQGRPQSAQRSRRQGQGDLQPHLQDPLAAGRGQRGRHRARLVQDGDDPAGRRQHPVRARLREFNSGFALGSIAGGRESTVPAAAAGPRDAFDDIADADRPAIACDAGRFG